VLVSSESIPDVYRNSFNAQIKSLLFDKNRDK
jgi:hypothetical protein